MDNQASYCLKLFDSIDFLKTNALKKLRLKDILNHTFPFRFWSRAFEFVSTKHIDDVNFRF